MTISKTYCQTCCHMPFVQYSSHLSRSPAPLRVLILKSIDTLLFFIKDTFRTWRRALRKQFGGLFLARALMILWLCTSRNKRGRILELKHKYVTRTIKTTNTFVLVVFIFTSKRVVAQSFSIIQTIKRLNNF